MRYTTILDLRDWPDLYRNHNTRLVYLHLCLVAGYHDYNRDKTSISIRQLAADTGCTVSAVRNSLAQLEKSKIVKKVQGGLLVGKWFKEPTTSPRTKKSVGNITTHVAAHEEEGERVSALDKLKAAAAAGDQRAAEILKKRFNL